MSWALWGMVVSAENWWHSLQFWMHFLKTWWLRFWKKNQHKWKIKKKQMTWEYAATVFVLPFHEVFVLFTEHELPTWHRIWSWPGKKTRQRPCDYHISFQLYVYKGLRWPQTPPMYFSLQLGRVILQKPVFLHRAEQLAWPFCRDFMISLCLL